MVLLNRIQNLEDELKRVIQVGRDIDPRCWILSMVTELIWII